MASLSQRSNGSRMIQFVAADGKRQTIHLGQMPKRRAESIKSRVEELVGASIAGDSPDRDTMLWVKDLDDALYQKLGNVGLVANRETSNLMAFVDSYIASRGDVKSSTATVFRRARRHLLRFFSPDCTLQTITLGDAKDFRRYLLAGPTDAFPKKKPLAEDTVRRTCGIVKQFLEDAVDRGLLDRNPFKHREIPTATGAGDKSREFFVSRELAAQVIDILPDAQWQLMFALARYGGLRCPSEVLSLRWGDIDWERGRLIVTSPKTEHHDGGDSRVIPLFPELVPYLNEGYAMAEEGTEFVITRYRKMDSNYGVLLGKLVRRAGLEMWPKPFQNLRATRETELAEEFPMHLFCEWIGNSQLVAANHYLQVTDDHFSKATSAVALQNALQQVHETPRKVPQLASSAAPDAQRKTPVLQGFA
ncbi:MAG: phage integrase SAM-like domain-containing protein, partial [Planctomycetaceae bacterium]|nr:phage integrase SAM-like domain-containing protein [Planctomycetaceae bacterium]